MKRNFQVKLVLATVLICVYGCGGNEAVSEQSQAKEEPKKETVSKQPQTEEETKMSIQKESFGQTPDGEPVDLYTLTSVHGIKAKVTNYGGIVVSLEVPDKNGKIADVILGYDKLDGYIKNNSPYFGAIIGRYANRIGKAKFVLNGVEYKLAANNGENHLHGGIKGFDKVVWGAEEVKTADEVGLKLTYMSKDGEEGYPGNLVCIVTYTLTKNDELKISYEAFSDKPTVVNLTNHAYWNLAGQGTSDILGHELMLNADKYTPVDKGLIPTGEIKSVKDSPMDFTKPMTIGSRIDKVEGGYDHNYVLKSTDGTLALCARVYEPKSGRVMEVYTTEPGIQLYTGNFLDGSITGKAGKVYKKHYGFCLETQHFPDSPNKPKFPSVVLNAGDKYTTVTAYKFSTK